MPTAPEIFSLAEGFVAGDTSLEDLDRWLARHAQELASLRPESRAARLAGLVEVLLAEADDGFQTGRDVRAAIRSFIDDEMRRGDEPGAP